MGNRTKRRGPPRVPRALPERAPILARRVSEDTNQADATAAAAGPEPGTPEPPRLRKRPFGYKRADVDEALATRDSQLAELRQDIAALWLAFAQHDRMIRELTGGSDPGPAQEPTPAETPDATATAPAATPADAESVGRQLSDLDEVLAAIEMATQTLERSYSDEVAAPDQEAAGTEPAASEDAPEQGGRTASP
jgi:hypothetical protein